MHSPTAMTEHVSLNLARVFFARPYKYLHRDCPLDLSDNGFSNDETKITIGDARYSEVLRKITNHGIPHSPFTYVTSMALIHSPDIE